VRADLKSPPLLKRYFRVAEVAFYFAISARTVYRLPDEGILRATRIRGCVRVSSEDLTNVTLHVCDRRVLNLYANIRPMKVLLDTSVLVSGDVVHYSAHDSGISPRVVAPWAKPQAIGNR